MPKSPYTAYRCPYCHELYHTLKEAKACAKVFKDEFKEGDLIFDGYKMFRVRNIYDNGSACLERIDGWFSMMGYGQRVGKFLHVSKRYCKEGRYEKATEKEVLEEIKKLKKRVRQGERVLNMFKQENTRCEKKTTSSISARTATTSTTRSKKPKRATVRSRKISK